MSIEYDQMTGWSNLLYIDNGYDPYSDDSYMYSPGATWFQRSWWANHRWARKYVNINNIPIKISSMKFLACPGHSNGLRYGGDPSGGLVGPSYGYGCTFVVDIYVNGPDNSRDYYTSSSSCTLPPIDQYNCYYGGYGAVSTVNDQTSFGNVTFYGPGTGRDLDSQGHKKYMHEQVFTFDDSPPIHPGFSMYIHVRPIDWSNGSNEYNSLLVVKSADPFFDAVMEPAEQPYIWRYDGTKWVKDRYAFKFNGMGWDQLKDN